MSSLLYAFSPMSSLDNLVWPAFTAWFCFEVLAGITVDATRFCYWEHFKYPVAWLDIAMAGT